MNAEDNVAIGSPVTAHMGLALKLDYKVTDRWSVSLGLEANHYSNGNTSWPNCGVNSIGAGIGVTYSLNPQEAPQKAPSTLAEEADRHRWIYDIMAYGAWRRRGVAIGYLEEATQCPGKFGIVGLQFAPLYRLNRWVAEEKGIPCY